MRYRLNLPDHGVPTQTVRETPMVYDPVRRKYVRATPEEWVRQHVLRYLTHDLGYPAALIAVEKGFTFRGMARRADVVAHDRQGRPVLMVECKAPEVAVTQAAFDQVARYNTVIQARYLVVTNGINHYCCAVDRASGTITFLDAIPTFGEATAPA